MSEKQFQEARDSLSFSQNLIDKLREQNMAQQSPEMKPEEDVSQETIDEPTEDVVETEEPVEEEVVEEPIEEVEEPPKEEPKDSETVEKMLGVIEKMVETDKLEEERRLKEIEEQHEGQLKKVVERVRNLLTRGKRK
jgi:hypothetical protein